MTSKFTQSLVLVCSIAVQQIASAEVPERWVETPLALAFGAPPTIGDPMLSPDGTRLVFLQQDRMGVSSLRVMNLASAELIDLLQGSEDSFDINHCAFANETRVFCVLQNRNPDSAAGARQVVAVNLDASDVLRVETSPECLAYDALRGGPRFERMADDAEKIMMICGTSASTLDVYTGAIADGGTVDVEWQPSQQGAVRPVGYGTSRSRLFNIAWDDESGTWALFRQNLSSGDNQLVFAHGAADVELVDTMGRDNRVVSAAFVDGRPQRAIVDRRVGEVFNYLSGLIPDGDIQIVDESWDQTLYLARVRSPNIASALLLVNMESEAVQSVGPEYDHLSEFILAEPVLFQIDGLTAQLTRPFNVEGPAPAVVIPRSSASHANLADPDYLVQFLAASGYVVLQVQNRAAGDSGWLPGRAVAGWDQSADDIRAAANFLTEQGFTQSGTICAAGKDYGAYAALMTATKYPDLFSCVVSISGLADASLISRADEITAQAMIFHGGSDTMFGLEDHAEALYDALRDARNEVEFIEYPMGLHTLERAPYRVDMLARLRVFLSEQIGPELADDESLSRDFSYRPEL